MKDRSLLLNIAIELEFLKSSGYKKCFNLSSPGRIKRPSISIRDNYQMIWNKLRRPETILEIIGKGPHFSKWSASLLFKTVLNNSVITKRKLILAIDLSSKFLNTETTVKTFQQSGKQDSFRQILKSSASMYASSGSQFFHNYRWDTIKTKYPWRIKVGSYRNITQFPIISGRDIR